MVSWHFLTAVALSEHLTQGVLACMCIAIVVRHHLLSFIMITTLAITHAPTMRMMRAFAGADHQGECRCDST
jgi:hypothetical protein